MSTLLDRDLAPLTEMLRGLADEWFGVAPGLLLDGGVTAAELAAPPYGRLREQVEVSAARWDAPAHVGAALWWKGFSYWTALPVSLGWLLGRRIPVMTADLTVLRPTPELPGMVTGLRELRATAANGPAVRETLIEDLHAPLIDALHALTRAGRRGLWGSVAEALADPILAFGRDRTTDPAAEAAALLAAAGLADLVDPPGPDDTGVRRRTCCLWVTLPGRDACPSCCVTTPRTPSPR